MWMLLGALVHGNMSARVCACRHVHARHDITLCDETNKKIISRYLLYANRVAVGLSIIFYERYVQ